MHKPIVPQNRTEASRELLTCGSAIRAELQYPALVPLSESWGVPCDLILSAIRSEDIVPLVKSRRSARQL